MRAGILDATMAARSEAVPKRIVVVVGHPDPSPERLVRALAESYAAGARGAGHRVDVIDLASIEVPFLRTQQEFEHGEVPPSLTAARDAVRDADHYAILFPLWLGGMPALLKAFCEQIFRPGIAFRYREKAWPEKLLKGRSARIVVTMGMPAFVYRLFHLSSGVKTLERGILKFVGVAPVRTTLLGGVGAADIRRRSAWIADMHAAGARAD
jgi:putative NADPH-quinone reductase